MIPCAWYRRPVLPENWRARTKSKALMRCNPRIIGSKKPFIPTDFDEFSIRRADTGIDYRYPLFAEKKKASREIPQSLFYATGRTRTGTVLPAWFWVKCVCQFRHSGSFSRTENNLTIYFQITQVFLSFFNIKCCCTEILPLLFQTSMPIHTFSVNRI